MERSYPAVVIQQEFLHINLRTALSSAIGTEKWCRELVFQEIRILRISALQPSINYVVSFP